VRKVLKEIMARDSLSTLDFIINVLREHEKELTELSERLEKTLTVVTGEDVKQALDELSDSVQVLSKAVERLLEKMGSQVDSGIRFRETVDTLKEESQRQRVQVNDVLSQLKALPTREDLENLRRLIGALNAFLVEKNQKSTDVPKG